LFEVYTYCPIKYRDILNIMFIGKKGQVHGDLYNFVPKIPHSINIITVTQAVAAIKTPARTRDDV
jgi:hypothetical protein